MSCHGGHLQYNKKFLDFLLINLRVGLSYFCSENNQITIRGPLGAKGLDFQFFIHRPHGYLDL